MRIKEIGKQIKERRKNLRVTQQNLADLAEISINTLYKLERGENNPSIKVLAKILDVLGLELIIKPKSLLL